MGPDGHGERAGSLGAERHPSPGAEGAARPGVPWPWVAAILAAAVLPYLGVLHGPFLFDDRTSIVHNLRIREVGNFLPPLGNRDVAFLTFALNYRLSGLETASYHAVNVAIHALNALLVLALFRALLRRAAPGDAAAGRLLPVAAALLFAAHPVQTMAVSYVAQRFASLAACLSLLSLLAYLAASERHGRGEPFLSTRHLAPYLLSLLCALLAMRTKETALALPAVIVLAEGVAAGADGAGRRRKGWSYFLPFLLALLVIPASYLLPLLRDGGGGDGALPPAAATRWIGRGEYLLTQARVVATYLRMLVLPYGQSVDHDYPVSLSPAEPAVLAGALLHAGLLLLAALLLARRRDGVPRAAAFGILWFYATLSVESSVIPIADVIAEQRLYLPSAGMLLAAAAALLALLERLRGEGGRKAFLPAVAGAALVLCALTAARNALWADPVALWTDAVAKAPAKARPRANLAEALSDRGALAEAEREYRAALSLEPGDGDYRTNLGYVLKARGRLDEALEQFREAARVAPGRPEGFFGAGATLAEAGRPAEAVPFLERALALSPGMAEAHVSLGIAHAALGRPEEALRHYGRALELDPGSALAHYNRGLLRDALGDPEGARADFRRALELDPSLAPGREQAGLPGGGRRE